MKRRELLAGAAGLGVVGTISYLTFLDDRTGAVDAYTIETIDAPGSEAGETTVPTGDEPTLVTFFATSCPVCSAMMPTFRDLHAETDVRFVSVTNEPVGYTVERSEVVEWWRDHEGEWTVGIDSALELTGALDVSSVPHTIVIDADRRPVFSKAGSIPRGELRQAIEDAR